jgi:mycothiol synthase
MEMDLPVPYVARAYRGRVDHPTMAMILGAYRRHAGDPEMPTVAQMDVTYANLVNCDRDHDIVIIETTGGEPVGYARASWDDLDDGMRYCTVFAPTLPSHPGPDAPVDGEAAWLESLGDTAEPFGAFLLRPHLDDVPDLRLPDGVEVRPVTDGALRAIWEAHEEAFRGQWDFREATEQEYQMFLDDPLRDMSLWKVAWAGDTVVGQVKSYINADENAANSYLRGYTEYISTHADWRNRGIAGALIAMSLRELAARGMTEAALGVDTDNPTGAFHLYTRLGFELQTREAVYEKPVS